MSEKKATVFEGDLILMCYGFTVVNSSNFTILAATMVNIL